MQRLVAGENQREPLLFSTWPNHIKLAWDSLGHPNPSKYSQGFLKAIWRIASHAIIWHLHGIRILFSRGLEIFFTMRIQSSIQTPYLSCINLAAGGLLTKLPTLLPILIILCLVRLLYSLSTRQHHAQIQTRRGYLCFHRYSGR